MEWVVLTVLVAAAVWGITRLTRSKRAKQTSLPPRARGVTAYTPRPVTLRPPYAGSSPAALPPRRSAAPAAAGGTTRLAAGVPGPRGVRPDQFPCCPFDKQRNEPGKAQTIFWDSKAGCYVCSRGHRFKSNGTIM